jgi:hypothetical protein
MLFHQPEKGVHPFLDVNIINIIPAVADIHTGRFVKGRKEGMDKKGQT